MVIQIIPKQPEGKSILANILLFSSIVLTISVAASYFILGAFLQKTKDKIISLDEKLAVENSTEKVALVNEVLVYQKKIDDFSVLVSGHIYNSQLFPFLENLTHPKVFFSSFSADIEKKNITFSGIADSFQVLGQQLIILKNEKLISNPQLLDIALREDGRVSFNFNLTLDPKIFKKESVKNE